MLMRHPNGDILKAMQEWSWSSVETSDLEIVTWKLLVQMVLLAIGMSGNSLGAQTLGP